MGADSRAHHRTLENPNRDKSSTYVLTSGHIRNIKARNIPNSAISATQLGHIVTSSSTRDGWASRSAPPRDSCGAAKPPGASARPRVRSHDTPGPPATKNSAWRRTTGVVTTVFRVGGEEDGCASSERRVRVCPGAGTDAGWLVTMSRGEMDVLGPAGPLDGDGVTANGTSAGRRRKRSSRRVLV